MVSISSILIGSLIISILHAIIPSHWLPVLAIGKQRKWSKSEVTRITFLTALAHTSSTVLIGMVIGLLGYQISDFVEHLTHVVAPVILITMGLVFIVRHHKHKHFQLNGGEVKEKSKKGIIIALSMAMFLSPCLEIEAYFLLAGTHSIRFLLLLSLMYTVITILGMVMLVRIAYNGWSNYDTHRLEHNAGIVTGIVLIVTGIISIFIH